MNFLINKRIPFFIIAIISTGVLITAYIMENYFGIQSCAMCKYERMFFAISIPITIIFYIINRWRNPGLLILCLLFITSAAFAFYHVLIQLNILPLPAFCKPIDIPLDISIEDAASMIMDTSYVPCNKITWSLFGISLAGYNFMLSLMIFIYTILGINHGKK